MKTSTFVRLAALFAATVAATWAGDLTDRFRLALDRVLMGGPPHYSHKMVLADAIPEHIRRFTNFSGDVSGRYIGAVALAAPRAGRDDTDLSTLVIDLLQYQKSDGRFGDPMTVGELRKDDMALLWGNGRLLIGLLEYYDRQPSAEVLAVARKMGDFLVKVSPQLNSDGGMEQAFGLGHGATGYICWTQNIEGLAALYRITKEKKYLNVAAGMTDRTVRFETQHSHGFLSSLRGIIDLYDLTGDKKYLEKVVTEYQGVIDSNNVLVHGAVPEYFNKVVRDEGCSEADWLRLNLSLFDRTGEMKYLEAAERNLFNEFAFNEFENGDFGHFQFSPEGISHRDGHAWWCCTLHGLRAFPAIMDAVFHSDGATLAYDLAVDGQGEAGGLAVKAESSLQIDGTVRLQVVRANSGGKLSIRVPYWAKKVEARVAGSPVPGAVNNGYLTLERTWNRGDKVTLHYVMRTRVEERADPMPLHPNERAKGAAKPKEKTVVFHGPWVLAVDDAMSPFFFHEPSRGNRLLLPAAGPDGDIELEPVLEAGLPGATFTVPAARFKVRYMHGGYSTETGAAILRPLAEKTATPGPSEWRYLFNTTKSNTAKEYAM